MMKIKYFNEVSSKAKNSVQWRVFYPGYKIYKLHQQFQKIHIYTVSLFVHVPFHLVLLRSAPLSGGEGLLQRCSEYQPSLIGSS